MQFNTMKNISSRNSWVGVGRAELQSRRVSTKKKVIIVENEKIVGKRAMKADAIESIRHNREKLKLCVFLVGCCVVLLVDRCFLGDQGPKRKTALCGKCGACLSETTISRCERAKLGPWSTRYKVKVRKFWSLPRWDHDFLLWKGEVGTMEYQVQGKGTSNIIASFEIVIWWPVTFIPSSQWVPSESLSRTGIPGTRTWYLVPGTYYR